MDHKFIVFNAARDNNLPQLKVSTCCNTPVAKIVAERGLCLCLCFRLSCRLGSAAAGAAQFFVPSLVTNQ